MEIMLDDKISTIRRDNMTLWQALSNTGGTIGFVYILFSVLLQYFTELKFQMSVLNKIFMYEPNISNNLRKRSFRGSNKIDDILKNK
jgi:hypothetical protein